MLSRSESHASSNLRRSKSSSSVQERRRHPLTAESLDPETSRTHAVIAAHRAMTRSHDHTSTDLDRSNSAASRRSTTRPQPMSNMQLKRQRSLLHERTTVLQRSTHPPPAYDALSTHQQYVSPDFGGVSENYGAEPSSYRKLRKARSMLTPRRHVFGAVSDTPISQAQTVIPTPPPRSSLRVRLQKSLSALRPSSRVSGTTPRPQTELGHHEEAVRLAREQMLANSNGSPVTSNATLHQPKTRRPEKTFRRSVRSGQQEPEGHKPGVNTDTKRIRTLSATIRKGFQRVLGKSTNGRDNIPPQHIEASRPYFNERMDEQTPQPALDSYIDHDHMPRPSESHDLVQQDVPPEVAPEVPPAIRRSGSGESLTSTSRSRVTSWSNSTSTGSLNVRDGLLPRNKLSVIKEDGSPYQPSCSAGRHFGGVGAFQEPLRSHTTSGQVLALPDSLRLYSALVKRIEPDEPEVSQQANALNEAYQSLHGMASARPGNVSTIREVSGESEGTEGSRQGQRQASYLAAEALQIQGDNVELLRQHEEKHRLKMLEQEEQSSFFPFSNESKPPTQSPFRRLLDERRTRSGTEDTEQENDENRSVIHRPVMGALRPHYGLSSESLYSQLSNGEPNPDYVKPVDSTDELDATTGAAVEGTGMATILPASHIRPSENLQTRPLMTARSSTDRREFKGWLETQMSAWHGSVPKTRGHYRERTQIDSDDVEIGGPLSQRLSVRQQDSDVGHIQDTSTSVTRFPLLELKEVPRNTTRTASQQSSFNRSQSGLLKRASLSGLATFAGLGVEEQSKISSSLRKISPSNVARTIRKRASRILPSTNQDYRKENKLVPESHSPPISTPGPLVLRMKRSNGRLRKRTSDGGLDTTPTNARRSYQAKVEDANTIIKQSSAEMLAASLSRPFSCHVPEVNEPLRTKSPTTRDASSENIAGHPLSEAPQANARRSNGYGGLGPNPLFDSSGDLHDKARPSIPLHTQPSKSSDFTMSASSRRMVSNFLRSRRMQKRSVNVEPENDGCEPAFM